MRPFLQSYVELHHLAPIVGLVAHLLQHLGLVLLVLQEGQHLSVLLLQALHLHQVALNVSPQPLFLVLDLLQIRLGALALRAALHQVGGVAVLHYITVRPGQPPYAISSCSSGRPARTRAASPPAGCSSPRGAPWRLDGVLD